MRLIVLHHHFRPGGVRRVIELALPMLRAGLRPRMGEVVLAGGEAPEAPWWEQFSTAQGPTPVRLFLEPAFGYLAEQRLAPAVVARRCRRALEQLLAEGPPGATVVWAHNLSLGRNLLLARELTRACAAHRVPLLAHHHDWWFDQRWTRWPEMRRSGFRTVRAVAEILFGQPAVQHLVINSADARLLRPALGPRVHWLPNPVTPAAPVPAPRREAARRWLDRWVPQGAPVWLVPTRLLRRKNLAEALLWTRWLRPEAWLVTTGGVSSTEEMAYARCLEAAADRHRWPLRLAVLDGERPDRQPAVSALMAAAEVLLLTSLLEGFGLPYLEAAAAQRPLLARTLPNIAPDLRRFGFHFPQAYADLLISPDLFDWGAERARQIRRFQKWRRALPWAYRHRAEPPALVEAEAPAPVAFSRLTLHAQLEVLRHPPELSWEAARDLNPSLDDWRERASRGQLAITRWPDGASRWLGAAAYARRFLRAWRAARHDPGHAPVDAGACQAHCVQVRLRAEHQYPLLWSPEV